MMNDFFPSTGHNQLALILVYIFFFSRVWMSRACEKEAGLTESFNKSGLRAIHL